MMARTFLMLGVVFGFLGVALGAFGAHGLAATFTANPGSEDTYHTATQYQMYHALALLGIGILCTQHTVMLQKRYLKFAGWLFVTGIILFSGSLYILSVFNLRFMGAVAPLGGLALLGGWLCVGLAVRVVSE
jgi:uncharacterized membrane protein YgdD (TMEM256/DUF423 family)